MLPQLRGDEALRYSYGVPPASPPLPAEHEIGGGRLCHGRRRGDPTFVGSQDAWFDSKPDDIDDKYIKWRNRPSTCILCAGDTAETPQAKPPPPSPPILSPLAAVKAKPTSPELSVEDELVQEPTESLKPPANQEQEPQITSVVEGNPTAAPQEQLPQPEPIERESPANQELQISMCEQIADHVDQAIFLIV
jgi:hypothetical protein